MVERNEQHGAAHPPAQDAPGAVPQPADAVREAVEEARSLLKVEYYDDGRIAAVGHDSDGLRKMVALLDAALSTPTEGPASQTEGMGGDADAMERVAKALHESCSQQDIMGYLSAKIDCTVLAQAALSALTPPETAEAVPDDLTAAYMAGVERGRDELRAERDEAVKALETVREDTARLDYLDRCNQALNAHYGKTYRWELVQSHNVNRLMLGHMVVDLNDSAAKGLPSCRDAIDCARRRAALATEASR